jgi:hypothetical protein
MLYRDPRRQGDSILDVQIPFILGNIVTLRVLPAIGGVVRKCDTFKIRGKTSEELLELISLGGHLISVSQAFIRGKWSTRTFWKLTVVYKEPFAAFGYSFGIL